MDLDKLVIQLTGEEGRKLFPYTDTRGKLTIGVGRNLTDKGISQDESDYLLRNDVAEAARQAQGEPWWPAVANDDVRARAMVDLVFNLGLGGVREFVHALAALEAGNFSLAADQFANSAWDHQVGNRAVKLVYMIRTGQDVDQNC